MLNNVTFKHKVQVPCMMHTGVSVRRMCLRNISTLNTQLDIFKCVLQFEFRAEEKITLIQTTTSVFRRLSGLSLSLTTTTTVVHGRIHVRTRKLNLEAPMRLKMKEDSRITPRSHYTATICNV
jgi:hypothetical protein